MGFAREIDRLRDTPTLKSHVSRGLGVSPMGIDVDVDVKVHAYAYAYDYA